MRIIFCNITYLRYYDGRTKNELTPSSGGAWVRKNKDCDEKWNFLNMDGYCFGYAQSQGEQMHIERLDGVSKREYEAENTTVVWCALKNGKTVIVGWYENATAFRYPQYMRTTPISGLDRAIWFMAKAEDAYLLPEEERTYEIGRASIKGSGNGFGQSNFWYADSEYGKSEICPKVVDYLNAHKASRINMQTDEFSDKGDNTPLLPEEAAEMDKLLDESENSYLPLGYRMFRNEPSADNAYNIALFLTEHFQYTLSIPWYQKTLELDSEDLLTKGKLAYIYQQVGMFEKSTELAKECLEASEKSEHALRDEFYSMIADNYHYDGKTEEAIFWLDRIIRESKDKEFIEYTKQTKTDWLAM